MLNIRSLLRCFHCQLLLVLSLIFFRLHANILNPANSPATHPQLQLFFAADRGKNHKSPKILQQRASLRCQSLHFCQHRGHSLHTISSLDNNPRLNSFTVLSSCRELSDPSYNFFLLWKPPRQRSWVQKSVFPRLYRPFPLRWKVNKFTAETTPLNNSKTWLDKFFFFSIALTVSGRRTDTDHWSLYTLNWVPRRSGKEEALFTPLDTLIYSAQVWDGRLTKGHSEVVSLPVSSQEGSLSLKHCAGGGGFCGKMSVLMMNGRIWAGD